MLHELFNQGYVLDEEQEKVALTKAGIVKMMIHLTERKADSYLALSFPGIGQEIVSTVSSPDWHVYRNGQKTDKIRPHWLLWGEQELINARSVTVDSYGRYIREGQLSTRVNRVKFDQSLSQVFDEFDKVLTHAADKTEVIWHVGYAIKTGLLTYSDFIYKILVDKHGVNNPAKIRFFADNMRDDNGLKSPAKVGELWQAHVDTQNKADVAKATKTAKAKTNKVTQPVIDTPKTAMAIALNGKS